MGMHFIVTVFFDIYLDSSMFLVFFFCLIIFLFVIQVSCLLTMFWPGSLNNIK